jgi:hypothetical protein
VTPAEIEALWVQDCLKWRSRVLRGEKCHWCYDWDGLPVDETTDEWKTCACYSNKERAKALKCSSGS